MGFCYSERCGTKCGYTSPHHGVIWQVGVGPHSPIAILLLPSPRAKFYTNLTEKNKYSGAWLESNVRGKKVELTRRTLATILGQKTQKISTKNHNGGN